MKLENNIRLEFLGTGTSQGVPIIGCDCDVCMSSDSRDKRLRSSLFIELNETKVLIDVGPDFRQQFLRAGISDIDEILVTHEHNDHVGGIDDVRPINFQRDKPIRLYAKKRTLDDIKIRYSYIFSDNPYPGSPRITPIIIDKDSILNFGGLKFIPVEVMHGNLPILGFRFGKIAYLTDVKRIDDIEKEKLRDLDILIVSALHHRLHHSHQTLAEALELIEELKPRKAFLFHVNHRMGKISDFEGKLPDNVEFAYDGLVLESSF